MQGPHLLPEESTDSKIHKNVNLAKIVTWVKDEILRTFIEALFSGFADVESASKLLN